MYYKATSDSHICVSEATRSHQAAPFVVLSRFWSEHPLCSVTCRRGDAQCCNQNIPMIVYLKNFSRACKRNEKWFKCKAYQTSRGETLMSMCSSSVFINSLIGLKEMNRTEFTVLVLQTFCHLISHSSAQGWEGLVDKWQNCFKGKTANPSCLWLHTSRYCFSWPSVKWNTWLVYIQAW